MPPSKRCKLLPSPECDIPCTRSADTQEGNAKTTSISTAIPKKCKRAKSKVPKWQRKCKDHNRNGQRKYTSAEDQKMPGTVKVCRSCLTVTRAVIEISLDVTLQELQAELKSRNLDTKGRKSELEDRLIAHDPYWATAPTQLQWRPTIRQ